MEQDKEQIIQNIIKCLKELHKKDGIINYLYIFDFINVNRLKSIYKLNDNDITFFKFKIKLEGRSITFSNVMEEIINKNLHVYMETIKNVYNRELFENELIDFETMLFYFVTEEILIPELKKLEIGELSNIQFRIKNILNKKSDHKLEFGRQRKIYTGSRGGRYYKKNGRKVYI